MLKVFAIGVLLFALVGLTQCQELKQRIEPKVLEESCGDHLRRISIDYRTYSKTAKDKKLASISLDIANELFWASVNLRTMPVAINICSKKELSRLDIADSLLHLSTAYKKVDGNE